MRQKPESEAPERAACIEDGERGESLAAGYLLERGYTIRERNYRPKGTSGEVDLIAEDGAVLVFVEVRYRRSVAFGTPGETVTQSKRRKVIHAAIEFVARHREHRRIIRFDVVSIVEGRHGPRLEHFQDAFDAELKGGDYTNFL